MNPSEVQRIAKNGLCLTFFDLFLLGWTIHPETPNKKIKMKNQKVVAVAAGLIASMGLAQAQLIISEVDPTGSSASYAQDWFELKNTGSSAISLVGWKMDDNSASFASAVALRGITSIAAGQTVVFVEGNTSGSTDTTIDAAFISAWFGGDTPSGFVIANYGGSGVGLSATADAVNIYNSSGVLQAFVSFNASTVGFTFDNTAGINGLISQLSATGVNGAFLSFNGAEVGSPGNITTVPEPTSLALGGLGLAAFGMLRRGKA